MSFISFAFARVNCEWVALRLLCFDLITVASAFFSGSAWPCFFAVIILGAEQHDRRELILCLHLLALHHSSFFMLCMLSLCASSVTCASRERFCLSNCGIHGEGRRRVLACVVSSWLFFLHFFCLCEGFF